jgi:hypothetical protein
VQHRPTHPIRPGDHQRVPGTEQPQHPGPDSPPRPPFPAPPLVPPDEAPEIASATPRWSPTPNSQPPPRSLTNEDLRPDPHGPDSREEWIADIRLGIRTALWRLVETLDLEQIQAEGETRAALVEDLCTDASYLCFEFLDAQPQLELYAELRVALAAAHAEAIAGLGPRSPRPPWCARPSLILSRNPLQDPRERYEPLDPARRAEIWLCQASSARLVGVERPHLRRRRRVGCRPRSSASGRVPIWSVGCRHDDTVGLFPGAQGRTRMTVLPLRRSVGLSAGTASSRVATVPMCVRRRPSRTRSTISTS